MKRSFTGYLELSHGDYYFRHEKEFFIPVFAEKRKGRTKCTVTFETTPEQDKQRKEVNRVIVELDKKKKK